MVKVIRIEDFGAKELDVYARLREVQLLNRHEPEKGIFIAESPRVIERALDAGCVPLSFLAEERYWEREMRGMIERCGDVPLYTAKLEVLTRITGYQLTRGMLCAMGRPRLQTVEEVCRGAKRIVVLENVVNPTNVGAIFRSAAALSMDGVLLTPDCSDPLYRRAIRVSMGTVFQIPWTYLGDGWIGTLREMGFRMAAMALTKEAMSVADPRLKKEERLALVLGTEGDGLAESTIWDCDYQVRIPMAQGVDSLNVAAASAVAFWELRDRSQNSAS